MRAWTIVLFILAIHACLAMVNVANITNIGLGIVVDTTSKSGIIVAPPGSSNITLPSSDPRYFDQNATGSDISHANETIIQEGDFIGKFIENIFNVGTVFIKFIGTFSNIVFSIHGFAKPFFGDFNAWVLEGMVDMLLTISLFQIVTGRSFKTME